MPAQPACFHRLDEILYHARLTSAKTAPRQAIMPDRSLTCSRAGVPPCPPNPPAFIGLTKSFIMRD